MAQVDDLTTRIAIKAVQERAAKERERLDKMTAEEVREQIEDDKKWFIKHKLALDTRQVEPSITLVSLIDQLVKKKVLDLDELNLEFARRLAVKVKMMRLEVERQMNQGNLMVAQKKIIVPEA